MRIQHACHFRTEGNKRRNLPCISQSMENRRKFQNDEIRVGCKTRIFKKERDNQWTLFNLLLRSTVDKAHADLLIKG